MNRDGGAPVSSDEAFRRAVDDATHTIRHRDEDDSTAPMDGDPPPPDRTASPAEPGDASALESLMPVIQRLERVRKSKAREASAWASLGRDRPEQLGDYRLDGPIGRGGMGVVFEATQLSLGRKVALKILPRGRLRGDERRRFLREAKTVASLHHTNIVPIYGVGLDEGCHYFVMERLAGVGLDQHLHDRGPLPPRRVALLGRKAASALRHAHDRGVLHRDIKPSNLIVNDNDDLWVTDFGVSVSIDPKRGGEAVDGSASGDGATNHGTAIHGTTTHGTARYMAPEQRRGGGDARSDIYSLGLTLHEMLTGRHAVDDATLARLMDGEPARSLPPLPATAPKDLAAIIDRATRPDPDDRYPSAAELTEDLRGFLDDRPVTARPLRWPSRLKRWATRHPAVAASSAVAALSLTTLAVVAATAAGRLRDANRRELAARRSAESSLVLAGGVLNDVVDTLAPPADVVADPASAATLDTILPHYDRLATGLESLGGSSDAVRTTAYRAASAAASMQSRLGRDAEAARRLRDLIDGLDQQPLPEDERVSRRRRLSIDLATALIRSGRRDEAEPILASTIGALAATVDRSPPETYDLARAHFQAGHFIPPGMGGDSFPPPDLMRMADLSDDVALPPPTDPVEPEPADEPEDRRHLRRVVELCRPSLPDEPPSIDEPPSTVDPRWVRLAAAAHRQLARHARRNPAPEHPDGSEPVDHRGRSIELLSAALEHHPDNETLRYELATTLAETNPRRLHEADESTESQLRQALELFRRLNDAHPDVAAFRSGRLHTAFKLARVLHFSRGPHSRGFHARGPDAFDPDEELSVSDLDREALRLQKELLRSRPDSKAYQAWLAVIQSHVDRSPRRRPPRGRPPWDRFPPDDFGGPLGR